MRLVVALGGNALWRKGDSQTVEAQAERAERTLAMLTPLFEGNSVCLTHGNGPQVGVEFLRNAATADDLPAYGLDVLCAETQGWIGYVLERAMRKLGLSRRIATLVTLVTVDPSDEALAKPTKFIGPFMTRAEAFGLADRLGCAVREDSRRGYRIVVPSPWPCGVVNADAVRALLDIGFTVVAAGGGGVPVTEERFEGPAAIIDKDRASSVLAAEVGAERLVILTGQPCVYLDFNTVYQKPVGRMDAARARALLDEGQFPPGSMGPKIEASVRFVERGGREVLITSPEALEGALRGETGTVITP